MAKFDSMQDSLNIIDSHHTANWPWTSIFTLNSTFSKCTLTYRKQNITYISSELETVLHNHAMCLVYFYSFIILTIESIFYVSASMFLQQKLTLRIFLLLPDACVLFCLIGAEFVLCVSGILSWAGKNFCRGNSFILFYLLFCVGVRWSKAYNLVAGMPIHQRSEKRWGADPPHEGTYYGGIHKNNSSIYDSGYGGRWPDWRREEDEVKSWVSAQAQAPSLRPPRKPLEWTDANFTFTTEPSLQPKYKGTWSIHVTDHDMQSKTSDWKSKRVNGEK